MRPRLGVSWVVWGMVAVALLSIGAAAQEEAQGVFVDVVINGQRLYQAGLVYGDRTFVRLEDVASVLGGRFVYDPDLKVAFVSTGRYKLLHWGSLVAANPKLRAYQPMSLMVEGEGVHYGGPGTHLTVVVTPAGVVTGFELAVPAGQSGHRPWFDQDRPGALPGTGRGYTHTLYVVHPDLIRLGGPTVIAWNGLPLRIAPSSILWYNDELYVRLRDVAVASGGGVGWDPVARVASAKVVPGPDLDMDKLAFLNPEVRTWFQALSPYGADGRARYGADGPSVIAVVDDERFVDAFEIVVLEEASPWRPWFDQSEGEFRWFGDVRGYTQRLYLSPLLSAGRSE